MPYAARTAHATPERPMGGTGLLADRHPVGGTAPHRRIAARERVEVHDLAARVGHRARADDVATADRVPPRECRIGRLILRDIHEVLLKGIAERDGAAGRQTPDVE